jgi:hypothetical protein
VRICPPVDNNNFACSNVVEELERLRVYLHRVATCCVDAETRRVLEEMEEVRAHVLKHQKGLLEELCAISSKQGEDVKHLRTIEPRLPHPLKGIRTTSDLEAITAVCNATSPSSLSTAEIGDIPSCIRRCEVGLVLKGNPHFTLRPLLSCRTAPTPNLSIEPCNFSVTFDAPLCSVRCTASPTFREQGG